MARILRVAIFAACASAAVLPAPAAKSAEATLDLRVDAAPGVTLEVENLLGSITMVGGAPAGEVRIEGRVLAEGDDEAHARAVAGSIALEPFHDGGPLRIDVAYPVDRYPAFRIPKSEGGNRVQRWLAPLLKRDRVAVEYGGRSVEIGRAKGAVSVAVHLTVHVPHDVPTRARQAVGSVHASRWRGELTLEAVDGLIEATQVYGALTARTTRAEVAIKTFRGERLTVSTGSGDVDLTDVQATTTELQSTSGTITARMLRSDSLNAETVSGDLELAEIEPVAFELATGSGAVELASLLRGTRHGVIRSDTGDVTLAVGKLTSFELVARSDSGGIKVKELPVQIVGEDAEGRRLRHRSGGRELRVRTGSGDLMIKPK